MKTQYHEIKINVLVGIIIFISYSSFGQTVNSHWLRSLRTISLDTAQTYYSGESLPSGLRAKINIRGKRLKVGKIYLIEINDYTNYHYILNASNVNIFGGDADETIDGSIIMGDSIFVM